MSGSPMHRDDAIWLAGLLDGEGALDAPRNNPRVRIKMSDLDVVLRAARLMDARVHNGTETTPHPDVVARYNIGPRRPLFVAQVTGVRAVAVLEAVLPFLGSRRAAKAAELILAYHQRHPQPRRPAA